MLTTPQPIRQALDEPPTDSTTERFFRRVGATGLSSLQEDAVADALSEMRDSLGAAHVGAHEIQDAQRFLPEDNSPKFDLLGPLPADMREFIEYLLCQRMKFDVLLRVLNGHVMPSFSGEKDDQSESNTYWGGLNDDELPYGPGSLVTNHFPESHYYEELLGFFSNSAYDSPLSQRHSSGLEVATMVFNREPNRVRQNILLGTASSDPTHRDIQALALCHASGPWNLEDDHLPRVELGKTRHFYDGETARAAQQFIGFFGQEDLCSFLGTINAPEGDTNGVWRMEPGRLLVDAKGLWFDERGELRT